MASLSPSTNLGGSVSSLIRSATSLQTQLANYQDQIQRDNFNNDPSTPNLNAYIKYLRGRINILTASGSITDASKALTLNNEIKTATTKSTTFNIDLISGQMITSGATDSAKLNYLVNNVLTNPIIQQSPDLYVKYQNEAYNLQQSIEYHNQQAATAAQVQASSDLAAQERGFSSAEAALNAKWTQIQNASKNGHMDIVKKAFSDSMKIMAPIYKANGIKLPKNAVGDMATAKVGFLLGKASFYENAAVAAGPDNPDYQGYIVKAQNIIQGTDLHQSLTEAFAPSNLYSTSVSQNGQVSQVENAISGYQHIAVKIPGLGPALLNIPMTTGNAQTPYASLGKSGQSALLDKLKNLGFNILSGTKGNGELKIAVSDKAAKWLNQPDLQPGSRLTAIPTSRGLQFVSDSGSLYGVSFDSRGLAGLYKSGTKNNWSMVGGQYGFNPKAPSSISTATNMFHPIVSHVSSIAHSVGNFVHSAVARPNFIGPQMHQRAGGGYNFTFNNQAISAARYSQLSHTPFRTLLQNMANSGDQGAKTALNFVGNDYGYNPNMIGGNAGLYNSLVWGAHSQAPVLANRPTY